MIRIPERNKRPGLCYAVTDQGVELPVVDVTHPVFAEEVGLGELAVLAEKSLHGIRRAARLPSFITRLVARSSVIMRGTMGARGTFLDGMTTYLYYLGPENLGTGYSGGFDRNLNRQFGPVSARLRHRDVSRMIAAALSASIDACPRRHVRMLNIGGGTASDSLNALILQRRDHPDSLAGRRVTIDVLDLDSSGPSFGARSLDALRSEGAPLAGLDVLLRHVAYDWTRAGALHQVLDRLHGGEAVVCSSEGGLFEYGRDRDVHENLVALKDKAPGDVRVVGSAVRPEPVLLLWRDVNRMPFCFRNPEEIGALAAGSGFEIERKAEGHLAYTVFTLKRSE